MGFDFPLSLMVGDRQGRWIIQGPACSAFAIVVFGISAGVFTHIVLSEKIRSEPWVVVRTD